MLVLSAMYKRLSRRVPEGRRALVDFVCHCLHCFFLGGHFLALYGEGRLVYE